MNTGIDGLFLAALITLAWHLFQLQPHPSLRQGDRGTMSLPLETSFMHSKRKAVFPQTISRPLGRMGRSVLKAITALNNNRHHRFVGVVHVKNGSS